MKSLLTLLLMISMSAIGQNPQSPYSKFGNITLEDMQRKIYPIDSNANAVILSDIGETALKGNSTGWFSFTIKRHAVVHILNKTGYREATLQIPLYVDGRNKEEITRLKAVTYNLENGKIITTKLEKSAQFTEDVDLHHQLVKFTMPQVKEGSIIEYQYEVNSDFISVLDPWYFQSTTAPTLWSEFNFSVPDFFSYDFLSRGYLPFSFTSKKVRTDDFDVSNSRSTSATDRARISTGVTDYVWAMKDVPELKVESFTNSIRNHIARMEFQLASQNHPLLTRDFRSTWQAVMKSLLESENFGEKLNSNNGWMSTEVKPLYAGMNNTADKVKAIFYYVRDHFTCTGNTGIFTNQSLKDVFKTKKGSVAEINLLLTAILRYAGMEAAPVLISTRAHGYAFEFSPMINNFNYVIVSCNDDQQNYYLDASDERLGFNKLTLECYNGHARMANPVATGLNFSADALKETKTTVLFFTRDKEGKWGGSVTQSPGYYESYQIRKSIAEKGSEKFFKEIQETYGPASVITQPSIDALQNYDIPLTLKYNIQLNTGDDDIIYINPTFAEGYKKNPFSAAERDYPVEMPYTSDETIISTISIPDGYMVDEIPKQMILKLDPEGNTVFEYRISQSEKLISFKSRMKINPALYMPEAYPGLREFFNLVVKKQNEQIVFKKKK